MKRMMKCRMLVILTAMYVAGAGAAASDHSPLTMFHVWDEHGNSRMMLAFTNVFFGPIALKRTVADIVTPGQGVAFAQRLIAADAQGPAAVKDLITSELQETSQRLVQGESPNAAAYDAQDEQMFRALEQEQLTKVVLPEGVESLNFSPWLNYSIARYYMQELIRSVIEVADAGKGKVEVPSGSPHLSGQMLLYDRYFKFSSRSISGYGNGGACYLPACLELFNAYNLLDQGDRVRRDVGRAADIMAETFQATFRDAVDIALKKKGEVEQLRNNPAQFARESYRLDRAERDLAFLAFLRDQAHREGHVAAYGMMSSILSVAQYPSLVEEGVIPEYRVPSLTVQGRAAAVGGQQAAKPGTKPKLTPAPLPMSPAMEEFVAKKSSTKQGKQAQPGSLVSYKKPAPAAVVTGQQPALTVEDGVQDIERHLRGFQQRLAALQARYDALLVAG